MLAFLLLKRKALGFYFKAVLVPAIPFTTYT